MTPALTRDDYVLAVLSTANGAAWTPVQVQKIFFLLDKKVAGGIGGPHFNFAAYDYGPFDVAVYNAIEGQQHVGGAVVHRPGTGMRTFQLTAEGQQRGSQALLALPLPTREYVRHLSDWVRSLSFQQLVSAVYREFPDMRANSVFRDPA